MSDLLEGVTWFRHSAIRIRREGVEVHVDPWHVTEESEADYILLTHPHYDNFSEEDIAKVMGPETVVMAPSTMKKQLGEADHFLHPGDLVQLDRIDVLAVPAHNQDRDFHPPGAGWLGYVFTVGGVTYYHAGHTDFLDAMFGFKCDVAFLPCCSDYTMGAEEAARAGEACGASAIVPIHWGTNPDRVVDTRKIAKLFGGTVQLLEQEG
jgi:L-ascorbate metabolism protein UlaG (beta-lactamase superfamily)